MANTGQSPGGADEEPIESRRSGLAKPDPSEPVSPEGEEEPSPELSELGEFAAESARPTPLDDIADAERERMPRD
jgi:hypothetical protein